MNTNSKRMKANYKIVDHDKKYSLQESFDIIEKLPKTKFDESVELHFHLAIDTKANEQSVRGTVILPHGIGKKVRVAVFCKGELLSKAENSGADLVGSEDLIDKVSKGFLDFDVVIAAPDMMRDLSKLGKVLGPRGLMPTPKAGTVTMDIEKAVKEAKAGKVEFKSDKQGGIHIAIGKRSFSKEKLLENAQHLIDAINHAKPMAVKVNLIKSLSVSTTMGPGLRIAL
ncbi:MAG TPA: 50S ribosomal protein L1 [Candidatus Omnitrophota bacterium]|nr:50S ribosomal protein L1 [Candidatus Omnitrophota bacterium]